MKTTFKMATLATLLVLSASVPVRAQEGLTFGFKLGLGAVASGTGQQGSRLTPAFAGSISYQLANKTALFSELRYRDFRSQYYEATRFGGGYTLNGVYSANGIQMLNTGSGATLRYGSVDTRRDTVESLGLAFGYRAPIFDGLSWQAGLSLDWSKSVQEVAGQIAVNTGNTATSTIEGLAATPSKGGVKPGVFAGVQYALGANLFAEFNAIYLSFDQVNYLPKAYTGNAPTTETKRVGKAILEACVGFRF